MRGRNTRATRTPDRWEGPSLCGGPSLVAMLALAAGIVTSSAYRTGPPAGYTGGFDEPSCHFCHFESEPNAPGGTLTVRGLPDAYTAGDQYDITVHLSGNAMGRAGFQLALRFVDGTNAGTLAPTDPRTDTIRAPATSVLYAQHVLDGTTPLWSDSTAWVIRWTAPPAGNGAVHLHIAANVANDDDSEFGDRIYESTLSMREW